MIYDNIIDKKAFDNLAIEVALQYPYFNSFRANKSPYHFTALSNSLLK